MKIPKAPVTELERLAKLKSLCILDTSPEEALDDLTRLAGLICDTPLASISLVDEKRLFYKSRIGFEITEFPRRHSFCAEAIRHEGVFQVPDVLQDERFSSHPAVVATSTRFYAGFPLVTSDHFTIGALCVADTRPHQLTDLQIQQMRILAKQVVTLIERKSESQELRKQSLELCEISEKLERRERAIRNLHEITSAAGHSTVQKIENLLAYGCEWSSLPIGVLTRIEKGPMTILHAHSKDPNFEKGKILALDSTFCLQAINCEAPLSVEVDRQTEYETHPLFQNMGMRVYLGTKILVGDEVFGSLFFVGKEPLGGAFSAGKKNFVRLMAQWIGYEILNDKHNSEIETQQKKMLYSAKMASLGEMAGGVAHEINNPLAVISGRSQLLRSQIKEGKLDLESVAKAMDKIDETVTRIKKVVRGLREFSRDAGKDEFVPARIYTIVEDTLELCRARFKNENIVFKYERPPEDMMMECRSVQVSQVLLNFLNNAADAVRNQSERWIELKISDIGEKIQFAVRDSGPGISPEIRDKIMDPFFTTKEVGQGTGLGLSVCLGLMGAHGGTLFLDTEDPHTSFVAQFPKTQPLRKSANA